MNTRVMDAFVDEIYAISLDKEAALKLPTLKVPQAVDRVRQAAKAVGNKANEVAMGGYLRLPSKARAVVNSQLADPDLPRTLSNMFNG